MLGQKGSAVHGLFQIWDLAREPERSLPRLQKDRLLAAPRGFPPGIVREYIETEGQFGTWYGVSNKGVPHSNKLLDYELMSEAGTLVAYVRRTTKDPHALDLACELSSITISPYDSWIAGSTIRKADR